jgi:hypothetical protein
MSLKDKKYKGIINIYTSIVFDYRMKEIRICNDSGRLTRPVLKVKDGRAIIDRSVIDRLESKEIGWNDLLTNCKLDQSVIEYIDPEEQNFAMIAMQAKDNMLHDIGVKYHFTHCEIHPSTIFGVLASCIPFPEHNQAPRNTYQCLHPEELVWMANGTKKMIKDVEIDEEVLSFHPETFDISKLSAAGFKVYDAKKIKENLPAPRTVLDLHIEKLTNSYLHLTNTEIMGIQLSEFDKWFDLAVAHRLPSFIVIHGVGEGVLRDELHSILKTKKEVKHFINQYDTRFGYGATEIFFK